MLLECENHNPFLRSFVVTKGYRVSDLSPRVSVRADDGSVVGFLSVCLFFLEV